MRQRYLLFSFFLWIIVVAASLLIWNKTGHRMTTGTMAEVALTEHRYQSDGIEAVYPQFSPEHNEQIAGWNKIIKVDFDKILNIYSFRPIPEPSPSPGTNTPTILKIIYEIKQNDDRYTGIFYKATFMSPYSAHPTQLVYTTNLDKDKEMRLGLSEIVTLSTDFVTGFRSWELVTDENSRQEVVQGIHDYIAGINDEDLLMGMQAADRIGSGNLYDIYSYFTPDKLGISIGVPNYLGDHAEFEQAYTNLKPFLSREISEHFNHTNKTSEE